MEPILLKDYPVLYGRTTNNKISEWHIYIIKDEDKTFIYRTSGFTDGKKTTAKKEIKAGKNIGRANETTIFEQACNDALSKWNKKVDDQYVTDIDEVDNQPVTILPMLAHKYKDRKHKISWPCYSQPKLNGVRCVTQKIDNKIIYQSRKGKVWEFFNHLDKDIKLIIDDVPVLDGEIFNPNLNFQEITRLIKKDRDNNDELEYWIYDCVEESLSFEKRNEILKRVFMEHGTMIDGFLKIGKLVYVPTYIMTDEEMLLSQHEIFTTDNYEGTMIRNSEGGYTIKHRSINLQKYKDFKDDEFTIIGGVEAEGEDRGTVIFTCKTKQGEEFNVRPMGTREHRTKLFQNLPQLIGKQLTVKYQDLTESGKPQFATGVAIRDYEG